MLTLTNALDPRKPTAYNRGPPLYEHTRRLLNKAEFEGLPLKEQMHLKANAGSFDLFYIYSITTVAGIFYRPRNAPVRSDQCDRALTFTFSLKSMYPS